MESTFQIVLDREQCNAMAAKLKGMGFGPEALEKGTLPEKLGVVLSYEVDVELNPVPLATVTFTVVKKPRFVPVSRVENGLKQMMGII
jgi:hypothetical protein